MENQNKQQPQKDDCEIEVKNTRTGKKIRVSGKCQKEQLEFLKDQMGSRE